MLCRNNWLDFSWEGHIPRKSKENLTLTFKEKANTILPFEQCCDQTAQEIADTCKNLFLALSGGLDSECIANCFVRNNIPFTPIIQVIKDQEPGFETKWAFWWCRSNNIEPVIYQLDLEKSSQEIIDLCKSLKARITPGLMFPLLCKEVEKYNGTMVTGMQVEYHPDEQFHGREGFADFTGFLINESDFYSEVLYPNKHPWGFFYWSPEMLASTIHHWDTNVCMSDAKSVLYRAGWRPKMFNLDFIKNKLPILFKSRDYFGTADGFTLGTKQEILSKLVK
jgi:hypothetical protein